MIIECVLKRDAPVVVPIGNEKYAFEADDKGRRVCEVWLEDHIAAFLAVDHLYRELSEGDAPAVADAAPKPPNPPNPPKPLRSVTVAKVKAEKAPVAL